MYEWINKIPPVDNNKWIFSDKDGTSMGKGVGTVSTMGEGARLKYNIGKTKFQFVEGSWG